MPAFFLQVVCAMGLTPFLAADGPADLVLRGGHVTRDTKEVEGGTIVRDIAGEPTGILKDNAMALVQSRIPEPTREMNLRAARAALREAARLGVTTVQDNSSVDALPTYQELRAQGELTASPREILATPVDLTVVGGRVVFERGQ